MHLYELSYGYVHCIGRTAYHVGFVDCRDAAEAWVRRNQARDTEPIRVPDKDPIRWCPVRHCHMKFQKPWFAYRPVHPSDTGEKICGFGRPAGDQEAV
jgi:hypothetical protein